MWKITPAQITFTVKKTDIGCNHSSLGRAEIVVDPISPNPPFDYLWNTGQITPLITNLEHNTYKVTITDALGNDTTVTVIIRETECEMTPEIVFTPNGDGYNDSWSIGNSLSFPNALVLVYNRWGQKVYEHYGLYNLPWDGRDMLGMEAPDASYYYIIYKDRSKEKEFIKGSVSILR